MVARKDAQTKMITPSFNRLMKTKLNLNAQVLSKNTSEMVSTYIAKIYKQKPNKYRIGLQEMKVATARLENRAPLRAWLSQEQHQLQNIATTRKDEPTMLKSVIQAGRRQQHSHLGGINRNLLKSPNYKIYSNRRYGSSASSSSGSLFRRMDYKRRSRRVISTHDLGQHKKSCTMMQGSKTKPHFVVHSNVTSLVEPARNQHMCISKKAQPTGLHENSRIHDDLMPITDVIKSRLRVSKLLVQRAHQAKPWNHAPPELFMTRNEQKFCRAELLQQHNTLQTTKSTRPTASYRQVEALSTTNPSLSSQIVRKRFAHLNSKKADVSPQPKTIHVVHPLTSLQYFASRKYLTSMQPSKKSPESDEYAVSPHGSNLKFSTKSHTQSKLYKICGRIAAPNSQSTAKVAPKETTKWRHNHINSLSLSASPKTVHCQARKDLKRE